MASRASLHSVLVSPVHQQKSSKVAGEWLLKYLVAKRAKAAVCVGGWGD